MWRLCISEFQLLGGNNKRWLTLCPCKSSWLAIVGNWMPDKIDPAGPFLSSYGFRSPNSWEVASSFSCPASWGYMAVPVCNYIKWKTAITLLDTMLFPFTILNSGIPCSCHNAEEENTKGSWHYRYTNVQLRSQGFCRYHARDSLHKAFHGSCVGGEGVVMEAGWTYFPVLWYYVSQIIPGPFSHQQPFFFFFFF